jgi:serine/threonine protein kinase
MAEAVGRYEILEEVGRGGFAIVHRARDTQLGREVALKELRPILLDDAGWVERFQREARAIALLDHPHIVPIFDVYNTESRLFLVMRLVNGPALQDFISGRSQVPWDETVEIVSTVAEGLDYAHRQGILHRDLKPGNILIDMDRGPMLSDFGLAKLIGDTGSNVSVSGTVVGTPHYIAPEVWEGKGHSPQSDIYALGCVLFEMLTGEKVFKGSTPPEVMMAHFQPVILPVTWPAGVPQAVADVLRRALNSDLAARFETAEEMSQALKELSAGKQPEITVQQAEQHQAPSEMPPVLPITEAGNISATVEPAPVPNHSFATAPYTDNATESEVDPPFSELTEPEEDEDAGWRGFFAHLGPYVMVIGMLAVINLITSPEFPWFLFPAIGWGIGLIFHLQKVLFGAAIARMNEEWRSFANHFAAYVTVIAGLGLIDLVTSPDELWFQWPAMGWGIGLGIHLWMTILGKSEGMGEGSERSAARRNRRKAPKRTF